MSLDVGTVELPIDDFVAGIRSYFGTTGDRKSKVWIFRDDLPSRFLPASFCAGDDDFRIELIDLFRGRHPLLINHDSLTSEIKLGSDLPQSSIRMLFHICTSTLPRILR